MTGDLVSAREKGESILVGAERVQYMDVSPPLGLAPPRREAARGEDRDPIALPRCRERRVCQLQAGHPTGHVVPG